MLSFGSISELPVSAIASDIFVIRGYGSGIIDWSTSADGDVLVRGYGDTVITITSTGTIVITRRYNDKKIKAEVDPALIVDYDFQRKKIDVLTDREKVSVEQVKYIKDDDGIYIVAPAKTQLKVRPRVEKKVVKVVLK